MELNNASGEAVWAVTTTALAVDAVIGVQEESSGINWKIGAATTVPTVAGAIYTPAAGIQALVGMVSFLNTGAGTEALIVYLRKGGTNYEWFRASLNQGEKAQYDYRSGWTVYTAGGIVKTGTQGDAFTAGTAFPTGPVDGQAFYRTDFNEPFFYDATRGKWLSVAMTTYQFGRAGNVAVGRDLRFGGNLVCGASSGTHVGFTIPYNITIVALAGRHDNSPLMQDGYLQVTRGASVICGQGIGAPNNQLYFGAGVLVASASNIDADFNATTLASQSMQAGWDPTTPAFSTTTEAALTVHTRRRET